MQGWKSGKEVQEDKSDCDVEDDVSCEYVLLPVVNKEAALGQWLNRVKAS